jgi:hypothetical protein
VKQLFLLLLGLCVVGVMVLNGSNAPGGLGAANDDDPEDRLCPNPYDPLTGEFVGFSDYPINLGPSQTVDFPSKLDKDGFIGPDEIPIDLDGDGTPDVEFEPPISVSGQGEAVYRCTNDPAVFSGGYGNPTGGDAG